MKKIAFLVLLLAMMLSLVSCGSEPLVLTDGTYESTSEKDEWGGYAQMKVEVKDGKIISCDLNFYEKNGNIKGEDYGKEDGVIKNPGLYKIAQNAIAQNSKYAEALIEQQEPEFVEVISGATVSYELFQDASAKIIEQAVKK